MTTDLPDKTSVQAEKSIAYIIKEAITNIIRHAQATHCNLSVTHGNGSLLITIEDNGRGASLPITFGNGLNGIETRVNSLGGKFHIQQGDEKEPHSRTRPEFKIGTQFWVELPLENLQ